MNRPAVVAARTGPTFCAYRKKEFVTTTVYQERQGDS